MQMTFSPFLVGRISLKKLCVLTLQVCSSVHDVVPFEFFRTCPEGSGPVWKALTLRLQVSFSFG